MIIDESTALIDNDFLSKILSIKGSQEQVLNLAKSLFETLTLNIAIHPLVYEKEVLSNKAMVDETINQGIVGLPELKDIHNDDPARIYYYSALVKELCKRLNGYELPDQVINAFEFWKSGSNLGEIHSTVTCMICKCGMFLSDDNHSKILSNIIRNNFSFEITIYNRSEVVGLAKQRGVALNRHQVKAITRV